jgi:hypothetical protein
MTNVLVDFRATLNQTRRKDRALPQIGRDVVKIGGMDGLAYIFRRAGDIRARSMRNKG